jgi:hypothetical protein
MIHGLSKESIIQAATELNVPPASLAAIAEVEAGPFGAFLNDGRPVILFERHVFARNTRPAGKYNQTHPDLSSPYKTAKYGTLGAQWVKFDRAARLDRKAAIRACSFGLFQVLGENAVRLGYKDEEEFFTRMFEGVEAHLEACCRFIRVNKLEEQLRGGLWQRVAAVYNGPKYAEDNYHGRLHNANEKWKPYFTQSPVA